MRIGPTIVKFILTCLTASSQIDSVQPHYFSAATCSRGTTHGRGISLIKSIHWSSMSFVIGRGLKLSGNGVRLDTPSPRPAFPHSCSLPFLGLLQPCWYRSQILIKVDSISFRRGFVFGEMNENTRDDRTWANKCACSIRDATRGLMNTYKVGK